MNTDLFPPFAAGFPELMSRAKKESYKTEGVGSVVVINAAVLSSLHFDIGGFPVVLSTANVLLNPTGDTSKFLKEISESTCCGKHTRRPFDFGAMTLTWQ